MREEVVRACLSQASTYLLKRFCCVASVCSERLNEIKSSSEIRGRISQGN